ncbi:MAG TPA: peptidase M61 [Allosphingosinicella sp.]|nr:peptidase M61 [Allosphingosinicella sp.]
MRSAAFAVFLFASTHALANDAPPQATAKADTIPAPRDIAYPGTLILSVDASDIGQGIFRIKEHIPVAQPGDLVLLYPKWLPGTHAPSGRINKVAGLEISANGRPLAWVRDTIDVYAFHVGVPEGAKAIDVEFQYVSPTAENQGRIVITPDMASIQWIATSLYPAGYYVRNIKVQPSLTVPQGWKVATALRPLSGADTHTIGYETVSYDVLADSPAIAGAHFRRIPLTRDVAIAVAADTEAELAATDAQIALHRNLVAQALKLFGAQHYDRYEFLMTISANLGDIGLEHHRSSEDGVEPGYFTDWDDALPDRYLLPHEYVHSWNGKYRRGRDLWTPDYRTPMEDSLLWVYEGQTQFWGYVLAARSGLLSKDEALGALALIAATNDQTPGRTWRPLIDTTNDPIVAQRAPQPWRSWQRSEDYYNEGLLIWADADRIIRQQSGGRRSLDDFARAFFGMNDRDYGELTYDFDEVVATLNKVQPYDWAGYLKRHVNQIAEQAPLEGLTQGGYRLVYDDKPTGWFKAVEKMNKIGNFSFSGGFVVDKDGKISAVLWDSAAFDAGMAVGSQLLAVDGRSYDAERMKSAIKDAQVRREPIKLLVKSGDAYRTLDLQWHGGLRYPRLEKTGKGNGTLDALLAPR